MMKPVWIKVLIGALGFAGGFASGFLVHKKMNDVQFEEITQEEMAAIENKVTGSTENSVPVAEKVTDVTSDEIGAAQKLPDNPDEMRNFFQGKTPYMQADAEAKMAYNRAWETVKGYSDEENANKMPVYAVSEEGTDKNTDKGTDEEDESPSEEDFDGEFLEQIEQEAVQAGNNFVDPPHQIDLADFYNEWPEYDQVTVKWYDEDNTWLDEHDEVIPDISSYTGIPGKNPFDEEGLTDDPDVRFWVNPRYGSKYEFVRHHISYREAKGE